MIAPVLKALRRKHLDVSLRTRSGYRVRIVERPGLWMTKDELARLRADLRQIASRTLDAGQLTYGVLSDDVSRLNETIITLVCRDDGTPIAFNALAIMTLEAKPQPAEVLHLGLVMVDPDERSKNLSWILYGLTCFLILFRRQFRPIWISNVTQVPAVVGMVSELFSDVWPGPSQNRRSLDHLMLARRIMADQREVFGVGDDAVFDENRFVIQDAYTGGSDDLKKTWDAAPKHRKEQFNAYCAETLNYERGDDVIQLGRMDLAAMRGYLMREVPRSAVLGLLLAGGLVALRRLVLPVLYWADSGQQWSTLRPATNREKRVDT